MLKQRRIFIRETRFDWTLNSQANARAKGLLPSARKAGGASGM